MPRKVSTGINTVRRRGPDGAIVRVDYYDRASGLYLGTDRDQAIQRAAEGRAPPAPPPRNTFAGLATAYHGSPESRALAPRTQALNRLYVDLLRDRFGDLPAAAITRPVVRALRDAHQAQPTMGNRLVSTLRLVLGYGVDIGTLATNAASRPSPKNSAHPRLDHTRPEQHRRRIRGAVHEHQRRQQHRHGDSCASQQQWFR